MILGENQDVCGCRAVVVPHRGQCVAQVDIEGVWWSGYRVTWADQLLWELGATRDDADSDGQE